MGAAAGKNLSSGKAQHASVVLASINDFNASRVRKDLDHSDATLEEFKDTLNGASRYSLSHGKDISESLSQLSDGDLETMRQYVKKKQFTQRLNASRSASKQPQQQQQEVRSKDHALEEVGGDGDDTSVLTYDNDELDEALDTFDVLEASGNQLKLADLEKSMDDRDRGTNRKAGMAVAGGGIKGEGTPTTSPSSLSSNDSAGKKGGIISGAGAGNSMLLSLTTSPEGDDKISTKDKSKANDRISDLLSRGDNDVWDLESSFDDDMPDSLKLPTTLVKRGGKVNTYMDPGEVIDAKNEALMGLQRQKVWSYTKNAQLQREVDVLHQQLEALEAMEKKLGNSPTPANAVNSGDIGSKSVVRNHNSSSIGSNNGTKLTPRVTPRQTPRQKVTPREKVTPRDRQERASGRQQQQYAGEAPHRQQPRNPRGGGRSVGGGGGGNGSSGNRQFPPRKILRDKLDPFPFSSQGQEGGQNNNSSSESLARDGILQEATPHRSAPQLGTLASNRDMGGSGVDGNNGGSASSVSISNLGSGDIARQRRPRRNRLAAMQQSDSTPRNNGDSDDSASVVERAEAWRQPLAHNDDSDSDNGSFMQSLGFRRKGGGGGGGDGKSALGHVGNRGGGNGSEMDAERGGPVRRPRRQRPKGFLQAPTSQQPTEGGGSSGPRLAPLSHDPSNHLAAKSNLYDQPIPSRRRGENEPIGPITEDSNYRSLRGQGGSASKLSSVASSGQQQQQMQDSGQGMSHASDSEKSDNLSNRRRRGRNVLQNANRRRRHTMDEEVTADAGGADDDEKKNSTTPVEGGTLVKSQAGEFIVPTEKEDALFEAQPKSSLLGGLGMMMRRSGDEGSSKQSPVVRGEAKDEKGGMEKKQDTAGGVSARTNAQGDGLKKRGNRNKMRRVRNKPNAGEVVAEKAAAPPTSSSTTVAAGSSSPSDSKANDNNPEWSRELEIGWSEVSFVLQRPIEREEDLEYTVTAAEAGLLFANQLDAVAKSLQVLRGTLTRWLLPYDQNTALSEQRSTPQSVIEHMPDDFRGKLTERQVHYLVAGANSIRKLVRIKIADDNDLEQAKEALKTAIDFFKLLRERAAVNNKTPFQLLLPHLH